MLREQDTPIVSATAVGCHMRNVILICVRLFSPFGNEESTHTRSKQNTNN